jgi:hypothetical protein
MWRNAKSDSQFGIPYKGSNSTSIRDCPELTTVWVSWRKLTGGKAVNVQRFEHGTARAQDSVPKLATQQKGSLWFEYMREKRKNKYIPTGRGYDAAKKGWKAELRKANC